MKITAKARIIVLSTVLLALAVVGGMLLLRNPALPDSKNPAADTPTGAQLDTSANRQIYTEILVESPSAFELAQLVRYGGKAAVRVWDGDAPPAIVDIDTWETLYTVPASWFDTERFFQGIAFDGANNPYALFVGTVTPDNQELFVQRSSDTDEPYDLIRLNGGQWYVSTDSSGHSWVNIWKFMADEQFIYIMSFTDNSIGMGLQVFTHDGELYAVYPNVADFDIDGQGGLYLAMQTVMEWGRYDLSTKELIMTTAISKNAGAYRPMQLTYDAGSDTIAIMTDFTVCFYGATDGAARGSELLLSRDAPEMMRDRMYGMAMMLDGAQNTYCLARCMDRSARLYRYQPTEDTRGDMPYTLTVTAPYRDEFLSSAIALFEKENPDQKINYDTAYNSIEAFYRNGKKDGYVERENMRLLTGDVGDIFMSGGTWADVYHRFQTDLFVDLKPMFEQDSSYSSLDSAALHSITIDGAIKGLPVAATYFYADVNTALCAELGIDLDWSRATWGDVLALTEKLNGTDYYLFAANGTDRIFVRMLISNMPDLIDMKSKKVDLRQPWFLELLEQWKLAVQSPSFLGDADSMGRIVPQALICINGMTDARREIDTMADYVLYNETPDQAKRTYPLFSGEKHQNRTASSSDLYSITAWSKNKDAAWRFLSFLVRKDMQSAQTMCNRPIHIDGRRTQQEDGFSRLNLDKALGTQYIEDINAVYRSVDTMYDMHALKEDLYKPLLDYMNGKLTLEDALTQAEHDLWIRINE